MSRIVLVLILLLVWMILPNTCHILMLNTRFKQNESFVILKAHWIRAIYLTKEFLILLWLGKIHTFLPDHMIDHELAMDCTCGSVVVWGSRLQPTVALSTIEAEYRALCSATQKVAFLRNIFTELFVILKQPTSMMEDTKSCISHASNSMTTSK